MRTNGQSWLWSVLLLSPVLGCGDNASRRLIADLQHADVEVRKAAIRELILAPRNADEIVTALDEVRRDSDVELRRLSVTALARVAPQSQLALDALFSALEDAETTVQVAAAISILQIDPATEAPREVILSEIRRLNPHAMMVVGELGAEGRWAAPALRQLQSHRDESVRELARDALQRVSSE